ncbi:beta family protein [Phenylobacterium sp.]|uniref:beta family protein n=1 Tax=Phenylobacterium sp. TaxID=1871053 RepID=UPI002FCA7CE9
MTSRAKPLYGPALRMKAGELQGLRDLAPDIADCTLPRMIVPPPADRDEGLQAKLFESAEFPDIAGPLAVHWPDRDVLIETTHLMDEFGRDRLGLWLPKMFERARAARVQAVPLAQLRDLLDLGPAGYRSAIDQNARTQFALAISSADLDDHESLARATDMLGSMGLVAERCVVIADFHDADLSVPSVVAPIIGAALDGLRSAAQWQQIIFQGTNFPETNPAQPGSYSLVPRSEWLAWRTAVAFDPETADYLMFGDYAADCAKLAFGGSGGIAIRHYRYATSDSWLVQRGPTSGRDEERMRAVCVAILASGHFAGRGFSSADDYIFRTARGGAGPGNAKDWRAVNTTHHITRVVQDVGTVKGRQFTQRTLAPLSVQTELFQ